MINFLSRAKAVYKSIKMRKEISQQLTFGTKTAQGYTFNFSGHEFKIFSQAVIRAFKDSGAENFLELVFEDTDGKYFTVTIQRKEGLTPVDKLSVVEDERNRLIEILAKEAKAQIVEGKGLSVAEARQKLKEIREARLEALKNKSEDL